MTNQDIATMLRELDHQIARHRAKADSWSRRASWFERHGLRPLASVCVYLAKAYMSAQARATNTLEKH